ncbi:hypothetical protein CCR75_001299 [Bremia lactucae]|uniref:FYVE-type domain-containing protein n=1 Tax=Bremia lactucae TaxID=4779 RepID=A0A976IFM2_BRELC|nr:hypothetical protein CCR75_001299 [Bremia lactucae]
MKPQSSLHQSMPRMLHLSKSDAVSLQRLANTLVNHNIASYHALDGHVDSRQWKELRRKDGIRVYKERFTTSNKSPQPCIPSLLLLGTIICKLEDVMLVAAAATDEQMKLTSTCLEDGVIDSKVLEAIVLPTIANPFRHVGIKWRLRDSRDYVCLDMTGMDRRNRDGEVLGYSISHSVAFAQVPSFTNFGIERANMSMCCLFRQKTRETVECYARGFFDVPSDSKDLLTSLSIHATATQWLNVVSKYADCAEMKKLVWRMRKNSGLPVNGPMAIEPTTTQTSSQSDKSTKECSVCTRSFKLSMLRRTCKICQREMCSSCSVKKLVCVLAPDRRTVFDKKRTFCTECRYNVTQCDALMIAKDEIRALQRTKCCAKMHTEGDDDAVRTMPVFNYLVQRNPKFP